MARRLLFILPAVLFLALAAAFYARIGRDPSIVPSALIGKPVPRFALAPLLDDRPGFGTGDLAGKVVIVNFFASWCLPCRAEHPLLLRLAREGVELYGVDYKDKPEDARPWLAELGNPYRRIGTDRDGATAIDWGVYGVPETFVIDRAGMIQYKQVAPLSADLLERTILPLVRQLSK